MEVKRLAVEYNALEGGKYRALLQEVAGLQQRHKDLTQEAERVEADLVMARGGLLDGTATADEVARLTSKEAALRQAMGTACNQIAAKKAEAEAMGAHHKRLQKLDEMAGVAATLEALEAEMETTLETTSRALEAGATKMATAHKNRIEVRRRLQQEATAHGISQSELLGALEARGVACDRLRRQVYLLGRDWVNSAYAPSNLSRFGELVWDAWWKVSRGGL